MLKYVIGFMKFSYSGKDSLDFFEKFEFLFERRIYNI